MSSSSRNLAARSMGAASAASNTTARTACRIPVVECDEVIVLLPRDILLLREVPRIGVRPLLIRSLLFTFQIKSFRLTRFRNKSPQIRPAGPPVRGRLILASHHLTPIQALQETAAFPPVGADLHEDLQI